MITDAIVTAFMAAVNAVVSLVSFCTCAIPTAPDASTLHTSSTRGWLFQFGRVLPLSTLWQLVLVTIDITICMLLIDLAFFVYHQFWGSD